MSENKKKCRQYNVSYLNYGFIVSPSNSQLPMCLVCNKTLSNEAMKPSRLQDHLQRMHPDKRDKDLAYFSNLREKFQKSSVSNLLTTTSTKCDDGLIASYNVAKLIAKAGKSHTIGEQLILPSVREILESVLHHSASSAANIIKKVPLSNDSVRRRIDEMAEDVEATLCQFLQLTEFSLQVDESTLPGNEALLLAYVRFPNDGNVRQEMLFARSLITDTKGESIFRVVKSYFEEKNIPLKHIISVATDGAPAMVGRHRGFIALLKKEIPDVIAVHCVIHRQHLVAKNLNARLHQSLQYVITTVNKIRSSALNDRLFKKMCCENDEDYNRLLLHTEVRWLSKGACLNRFWDLFDSVIQFLEERDTNLKDNLQNFKTDIAYITDLFSKFNEINLQLQGDDLNMIKTKSVVSAFLRKLSLWKQNFGRQEFRQFPILASVNQQVEISFEDTQLYCEHLESLANDFSVRFEDILSMSIPRWVLNPFQFSDGASDIEIQEELAELSSNEQLKANFHEEQLTQFWLQPTIHHLYPKVWACTKNLLIGFPSSYLVERGFSAVANLMTKKRNRLQITDRGDLRLNLTKIEPNVRKLAQAHQAQPSH